MNNLPILPERVEWLEREIIVIDSMGVPYEMKERVIPLQSFIAYAHMCQWALKIIEQEYKPSTNSAICKCDWCRRNHELYQHIHTQLTKLNGDTLLAELENQKQPTTKER